MLEGCDQIRENELTGTFLVVTVKHLSKKKVKAKLATLRYQAKNLEDELLEAATPTAIRRGQALFLASGKSSFRAQESRRVGSLFPGTRATETWFQ